MFNRLILSLKRIRIGLTVVMGPVYYQYGRNTQVNDSNGQPDDPSIRITNPMTQTVNVMVQTVNAND